LLVPYWRRASAPSVHLLILRRALNPSAARSAPAELRRACCTASFGSGEPGSALPHLYPAGVTPRDESFVAAPTVGPSRSDDYARALVTALWTVHGLAWNGLP